jgi:hypothetical protein
MTDFVVALFFGSLIYLVGFSLWFVLTGRGDERRG